MKKLPDFTSHSRSRASSVTELIAASTTKDVDELCTDAQTLFGLLTLIVDIKYRIKYGHSLGNQADGQYSESIMKKVVADQISPVDDGLLRH